MWNKIELERKKVEESITNIVCDRKRQEQRERESEKVIVCVETNDFYEKPKISFQSVRERAIQRFRQDHGCTQ